MLNHITIMGRLTRDPELRRTGSGIAVTSFTVAVDRDYKSGSSNEKEVDFIDCVAWRQAGEFVAKYFTKGRMIVVSGALQIRSWTDKDGNKRRTAEVNVSNAYFGDSKNESANTQQAINPYLPPAPPTSAPGYAPSPAPSYGAPAPAYQDPAYGGYSAPAPGGYSAPSSDFAMLDDDDAQLPF